MYLNDKFKKFFKNLQIFKTMLFRNLDFDFDFIQFTWILNFSFNFFLIVLNKLTVNL